MRTKGKEVPLLAFVPCTFVFYMLYPCILQPPPKLFIHSDNPLFISSRTEARRTTQRKRPGEIINSTLAQYDW